MWGKKCSPKNEVNKSSSLYCNMSPHLVAKITALLTYPVAAMGVKMRIKLGGEANVWSWEPRKIVMWEFQFFRHCIYILWCELIGDNIGFNLQEGLSVMIDEYGRPTCNCHDSAMGYSKETQTCLCPSGSIYTEDQANKCFFSVTREEIIILS